MATAPTSRRLNLTRDQLATFLTDQQQIRQFELLFATVDQIQVIVGTDFEYQADNAAATANDALAQISRLAQALELLALAPVPNNVDPAQDPYECCNSLISQLAELKKQIEGLEMQPPPQEVIAGSAPAPAPPGSLIPEFMIDPASPSVGEMWIKKTVIDPADSLQTTGFMGLLINETPLQNATAKLNTSSGVINLGTTI